MRKRSASFQLSRIDRHGNQGKEGPTDDCARNSLISYRLLRVNPVLDKPEILALASYYS